MVARFLIDDFDLENCVSALKRNLQGLENFNYNILNLIKTYLNTNIFIIKKKKNNDINFYARNGKEMYPDESY